MSDGGELEKIYKLDGLNIISFFGNVGESKGVGLLYNKENERFFSIFCPTKEKVIEQFPVTDSGRKTVIGGKVIGINDFEKDSDSGSITFYDEKNGEVLSKIQTTGFPKFTSIENKLFYKMDQTTFVGYDLREQKNFLKETVKKYDFEDTQAQAHILDKDIWLFDCKGQLLTAYQIVENKLNKKWDYPSESSLFQRVILALDQKQKKLWGIHVDLEGQHIYKWDALSGELEQEETLSLSRAARIIAFHPDGTPIIQTNSY